MEAILSTQPVINNLKNMCRACTSLNLTPMISLFTQNLADTFKSCSSLKISENDNLPQNICTNCVKILEKFIEFRLQCQKSEAKFLSYLKNNNGINEDVVNSSMHNPKANIDLDNSINNEDSKTLLNSIDTYQFKLPSSSTNNRKNAKLSKFIAFNTNSSLDSQTCLELKDKIVDEHKSTLEKKSPCGLIEKKSDNVEKIKEPNDQYKMDKGFLCNECDFSGIDWADFYCHRYAHQTEPNVRFECGTCDKVFFSIERLEFHIRQIHLGKSPGVCKICSKEFMNIKNFQLHKLMHAGIKPNKCQICSKSFVYKRSLVLHMRCHEDTKKYICQVCGIAFKFRTGLNSHQFRLHSNVKPVACNHCEKIFKNKETLREHLLRITSDKNFKCPHCNKMYRSQRELNIHSKWHSDIKPHKCKQCSKSYKCKSHLANHMRQHTGERPYQCDTCKNSFMTANVLKKHKMIHTGIKSHVCKFCGKAFTEKSNLKSHMKTHVLIKTESFQKDNVSLY